MTAGDGVGGGGALLGSLWSRYVLLSFVARIILLPAGSTTPETDEERIAAEEAQESNTETNDCVRKDKREEVESIYLDDGLHKRKTETTKPQRKLTKVYSACLSFGH